MSTRRDNPGPVVDDDLSDVPRKDPREARAGDHIVEEARGATRRRHEILRLERSPEPSNGNRRLVFEPIPNAVTYLTPDEVLREGKVVVEDSAANA